MIKPAALKPGDRVAAITLSWGGPGAIPRRYAIGKKQLQESFGIVVVETRHAMRDPDWIYQNPRARADDLMESFSDPNIKAIFATIGGDESVRTLPFIDVEVIRRNPKIFMGYSDTTVTHFACFKAGLVSFYGPSIMAEFAENGGILPYTRDAVRRTLFSTDPVGEIQPSDTGWTVEHLEWNKPDNENRARRMSPMMPWKFLQGKGTVSGPLIGGCFEVLEFLKGTSYWPSLEKWKGAVLFVETSEDAPPPMFCEYWLRNYASQGILQQLSGILIGRPGGHSLSPADFDKYDAAVIKVVREFGLNDLPIISRMDFGHTDPKFILPIGAISTINCDDKTFRIDEAAVVYSD